MLLMRSTAYATAAASIQVAAAITTTAIALQPLWLLQHRLLLQLLLADIALQVLCHSSITRVTPQLTVCRLS
jgi:hypothetical protein